MIVDSHAHVFPPMGGASGHRTRREHMAYIQHMLMFHHQPVRRVDDNSIVSDQTLYNGHDVSMDGLTEVNFRGGEHGKFLWSVGGIDYYLQYLPNTLTKLAAPPELMVAQMDYAGVDRAVIQTGHSYGKLNQHLSDAVRKFPGRLWALAMIDEWRADDPSQIHTLDHAINGLGLNGLWFQTGYLPQQNRKEALDDPVFRPFWDHVNDMGIPVYMNVTSPVPGPDAYLAELEAFGRWVVRYPDVKVMLPHGLPLFRFMGNGQISIPPEVWGLMSAPNVLVEILIPIFQGSIWEYPYFEAQPIIRQYYERLGPEKLGWGSDMPNVERHCTYRQSLDYLRRHCDFIPMADMAKICGGNVARLFGR